MTTLKLLFPVEEKAEITRRMKRDKRDKLRNGSLVIPNVPLPFRRETDRTVKPVKHPILITLYFDLLYANVIKLNVVKKMIFFTF